MKSFVIGAVGMAALAGVAAADINGINGLTFNAYENFRNPNSVIPSALTLNGGAIPAAFNGNFPTALGANAVREVYPAGTAGFANRHILWLSDNGGASAYQLQAGESFRVQASFRMTAAAPYPFRTDPAGPPPPGPAAETGIWINNARHDEMGNPFIDEGGIWGISNGTSFSGGAGMDFFLYGEGNGNPSAPHGPIFFVGDVVTQTFEYFAPGYFGPGSLAGYQASVVNETRGISVSSPLLGINTDGSGFQGFGPGTTIGFRMQNAIFPIADTDITTEVFGVSVIPGPGAMALLGLGGLAASRRRR